MPEPEPVTNNDDRLMIEIQAGNSCAFEELVDCYQAPLIGFFFRNTRDRQMSEDLTQETLLRVYSQSWDYLPMGRFRGWMYRIARNLMIDSIRRQSHDALIRAVQSRDEDDNALARLVGEVVSPEDQTHVKELAQIVDNLLQQLPELQRTTFVMHHYAGLTLSEVADATETTTSTAKSRLRLAREKLQEKLLSRGVRGPAEEY
ncbi:ECF RNA polymerase sigma factor SigW [Symmachiella dynata]|uniref:RNA polymerase sigma factor n=1 Tax=Symmachiella dynata TaxID=2527995 RepID=UPI001188E410|nr:sigma-70 family RNA polymerase sigma factor [Symmachiella dynata]QDT50925.1 ECF RNA polymerase sigma factor SigW [Symmachiella dynata]